MRSGPVDHPSLRCRDLRQREATLEPQHGICTLRAIVDAPDTPRPVEALDPDELAFDEPALDPAATVVPGDEAAVVEIADRDRDRHDRDHGHVAGRDDASDRPEGPARTAARERRALGQHDRLELAVDTRCHTVGE